MDVDPEVDVTLSNGRRIVTFEIAALDRHLSTWTVVEPLMPPRVILGDAEALDRRRRLDARIAARLAAGWVPVDPRPAGDPGRPLPADLTLYLRSLFEAVTEARQALRAADSERATLGRVRHPPAASAAHRGARARDAARAGPPGTAPRRTRRAGRRPARGDPPLSRRPHPPSRRGRPPTARAAGGPGDAL